MRRRRQAKPSRPRKSVLLERTSAPEIRATRAHLEAVLEWHWRFYSEFENQRRAIETDLLTALARAATSDFKFEHWQRAVKYRYALDPLSAKGSLVDLAGGRFNIGDIAPARLPRFSALYLSRDKDTALQEALGQTAVPGSSLTARDLALQNPQSTVVVSVSGHLESVVDLEEPSRLEPFVKLVAGFTLSSKLRKDATRLRCAYRQLKTLDELMEHLLDPQWRFSAMQFDIPSPSQIFGRLVMQAGVEGILFPSKMNGRQCLAVFPPNLARTSSFVELDDDVPPGCAMTRLDATNWERCETS